jgi:hypothetical protein
MQKQTFVKILFAGALIAGISLSIASIAVAPLLYPGITLIAASLGFFQGSLNKCAKDKASDVPRGNDEEIPPVQQLGRPRSDSHDVTNVQTNLFFMYQPSNRGDDIRLPVADNPTRLTLV